jgi:hypothetical protein
VILTVSSNATWADREGRMTCFSRPSGRERSPSRQPYRVPDAPNWIGDLDRLTAVTWTPTLGAFGALLDRGSGYVAVEWA